MKSSSLALFLAVAFSVSSFGYDSDYDETVTACFFLGLEGNYSMPVRLSEKSYSSSDGYGSRIGFRTSGLRGFVGADIYLAMEKNAIKLKNQPVVADVYHSYFGWQAILYGFKVGMGIGGLKFDLPAKAFNDLGGTTLTELNNENRKIQMAQTFMVGARMPIPVENDFLNRWAVDYEYKFVSADRAWMFWHDLISSSIVALGADLAANVAKGLEKKDFKITSLLLQAAIIGFIGSYWYYDYEYHNWPFKDESPYRMHAQAIVISYDFKRFD